MIIRVNGQVVEVPDGACVSVGNGSVVVGGTNISFEGDRLKIEVEGGLASLKVDRGSVTCWSVFGDVDAGGSVTVSGVVGGKVDAGGSVNCKDVRGNVDAGGSVNCGAVGGKVDAGGSVRHG